MEWQIFKRALELPRDEQEAFIVQACGEDTKLLDVTLERLKRLREIEELDFSTLTRAERLIIILYHYEEMTFNEIGCVFDHSEEEIGRMYESILTRKAS